MAVADQSSFALDLSHVLRGIEFDRRYHGCFAEIRHRESAEQGFDRGDIEAALAGSPLTFTYNEGERFFGHLERREGYDVGLNLACSWSSLELILVLRTARGHIGGPFPMLALDVARDRDPAFTLDPPYPHLPFHTHEQLREVVDVGLELYADVRQAIVDRGHWGTA
jgi:hypothetical protein